MQTTIENWCNNHPAITRWFAELNKQHVKWAIFAGTSVSLLTGNRMPTDLDILVHEADFTKVIDLTPQAKADLPLRSTIQTGDRKVLRYKGYELTFRLDKTDIEVMGKAEMRYGSKVYDISFSDTAVKHRLAIVLPQATIFVANPFDTIAIKAIMQRGAEQGKFDLEDTQALIKAVKIDKNYAEHRAGEIGLDERALAFLRRAGLEMF